MDIAQAWKRYSVGRWSLVFRRPVRKRYSKERRSWFSCQGKGTPTIGGGKGFRGDGKRYWERGALMGGWEQWNDGSDERTVM